jgi:ribosomal protein S21
MTNYIEFGGLMSYNRHSKYNRHNRDNRDNRNKPRRYVPLIGPKKPSNLTVVPRPNEPPERFIKRFIKKCKKLKIIETYREKTDYYQKPSVIKRKKAIRRLRAIKKANQKESFE